MDRATAVPRWGCPHVCLRESLLWGVGVLELGVSERGLQTPSLTVPQRYPAPLGSHPHSWLTTPQAPPSLCTLPNDHKDQDPPPHPLPPPHTHTSVSMETA